MSCELPFGPPICSTPSTPNLLPPSYFLPSAAPQSYRFLSLLNILEEVEGYTSGLWTYDVDDAIYGPPTVACLGSLLWCCDYRSRCSFKGSNDVSSLE